MEGTKLKSGDYGWVIKQFQDTDTANYKSSIKKNTLDPILATTFFFGHLILCDIADSSDNDSN